MKSSIAEQTSMIVIKYKDGHLESNGKLITLKGISEMKQLDCILFLPDNGRS